MLDTITLTSKQISAQITATGAELQSLRDAAGRELLWSGDCSVWKGQAPILFPVIGVVNGGRYQFDGKTYEMTKHGFARQSLFEVTHQADNAATLRLSSSTATRAMYPFEFQLDVSFALSGASLAVSATISNLGADPMPASFGFHPAFRWPLPYGDERSAHAITFEHEELAPVRRIDRDGLLLPEPQPTSVVGNTLSLKDELFAADAIIFDRLKSRRVEYGCPVGKRIALDFNDFTTLALWTKPSAEFICIEPWHGISDPMGFTGDIRAKPGIFEVPPGGDRKLEMRIHI